MKPQFDQQGRGFYIMKAANALMTYTLILQSICNHKVLYYEKDDSKCFYQIQNGCAYGN